MPSIIWLAAFSRFFIMRMNLHTLGDKKKQVQGIKKRTQRDLNA